MGNLVPAHDGRIDQRHEGWRDPKRQSRGEELGDRPRIHLSSSPTSRHHLFAAGWLFHKQGRGRGPTRGEGDLPLDPGVEIALPG